MVTLIAINLGYVVAGAITAEVVFNWPGLGTLTVTALDARDYPLPQGSSCSSRSRSCSRTSPPTWSTAARPAGADVSVTAGVTDRRRALRADRRWSAPRFARFLAPPTAWSASSSSSCSGSWPSRRSCSSGRSRRPHHVDRRAAPAASPEHLSAPTSWAGHAQPDRPRRPDLDVIGLMATLITVVIGALVGIVAGFVGGRSTTR